MKVNYVLMYGIPYVRYKEFETFEDISKFLVHKGFVNYSIFKKLEDKEEIEMIYRDNDIRYLEDFVKKQDKEIKRLKELSKVDSQQGQEIIIELKQEIERLNNIINELEKFLNKRINFYHKTNITNYFENKDILDKLQELKRSNLTIPPEVIGTNGEDGGLFDYGDKGE